jgi:type III restriction enzyme
VSDFGLMDAIESGIVKVPRVPVSDDSMTGDLPTYRDLWLAGPRRPPEEGHQGHGIDGEPVIPKELEGALLTLYADYERSHDEWVKANMGRPPVFIVVCSNTSVSKLVFDWIAGWDKTLADGSTVIAPGNLALFSNVADGRWLGRAEHDPHRLRATGRGDASIRRSRRRPPARSRSSSASTSPASPGAAPRTSPTRTSCARS